MENGITKIPTHSLLPEDFLGSAGELQNNIFNGNVNASDLFKDYFIFRKPKYAVSGDFYFFEEIGQKKVILVGDSTLTGVEGAIMSALFVGSFREQFAKYKTLSPSFILQKTLEKVCDMLKCPTETFKFTLVFIDSSAQKITFSTCQQELYLVSHKINQRFKKTKGNEKSIEEEDQTISYESGAMLYAGTDGYTDQKGGPTGKEYGYNQLHYMLTDIHPSDCSRQSEEVSTSFTDWKGKNEQDDDILLMGVRL